MRERALLWYKEEGKNVCPLALYVHLSFYIFPLSFPSPVYQVRALSFTVAQYYLVNFQTDITALHLSLTVGTKNPDFYYRRKKFHVIWILWWLIWNNSWIQFCLLTKRIVWWEKIEFCWGTCQQQETRIKLVKERYIDFQKEDGQIDTFNWIEIIHFTCSNFYMI